MSLALYQPMSTLYESSSLLLYIWRAYRDNPPPGVREIIQNATQAVVNACKVYEMDPACNEKLRAKIESDLNAFDKEIHGKQSISLVLSMLLGQYRDILENPRFRNPQRRAALERVEDAIQEVFGLVDDAVDDHLLYDQASGLVAKWHAMSEIKIAPKWSVKRMEG